MDKPRGVFLVDEGWSWFCPESGVTGTPVVSRAAARAAYAAHVKELKVTQAPASTPAAEASATPPVTEPKETQTVATKKTKKRASGASKRSGAVSRVRDIIGKMKGAARKDVIAALVKAGINENTAKTQYQRLYKGDK
jgi:hypothetical protein